MSSKSQRLAGTNDVPPTQPVQQLNPGGGFCQADTLFGGSAGLRVLALTGGKPGPALSVIGAEGAQHLMQGGLPNGWHEGWIVIPTRRVPATVSNGDVCFVNHGSVPVTVMGYDRAVRFEFLRPGSESWWSMASTIAHRMAVAKAGWIGAWTVWPVILVVVAAMGLSAWLLMRRPVSS
jgi:hypothetical protein